MENQNHQPSLPQPYSPQPFQQIPGAATMRTQPPVVSSRGWHIAKMVLHSLTVVLCIVVLGIVISISLNYPSSAVTLIWTVPQVGVSLCWAVAEMITVCARRGHRGIHPGAHVALHLLLWLGLCVAVALNVILLASWLLYYDDYYYSYDYGYYYDDIDSEYLSLIKALVAFLALLIITHFTLFVRACVETSRRNTIGAPVYMMPVPMYQQHQQQYAAPAAAVGYPPIQSQGAHLSGQYDQGKEAYQHQHHQFDRNSVSGQMSTAASSPPPIQDDGLHMHPPHQS